MLYIDIEHFKEPI